MKTLSLHGILFLAAFAPILGADTRPTPTGPATAPDTFAVELERWQSAAGPGWCVRTDSESGELELLYGGRLPLADGPRADGGQERSDAGWLALGESALRMTQGLHGLDLATLAPVRALHLPLGQVGSGDKWTLGFRQSLHGVPVLGGTVNVLCDADGALLAIESHALAHLEGIAAEPAIPAVQATEAAVAAFGKHAGEPAFEVGQARLVVRPITRAGDRRGHLAWEIDVQSNPEHGQQVGFTYWVDAVRGHVLERESSVHTFDISGTISTRATPGTLPDTAANPETLQGAKYIRIQNGTVNVTTDVNGNFNIPGVNTPQNVTLTYDSPFVNVENHPMAIVGSTYSLAVTLNPGSGNAITLNPGSIGTDTAQANVFQHVATVRDYVRRINPSDSTADAPFNAFTNINAECNAFYSGSLNFYAQSPGGDGDVDCVNTAYSTVIAHEQGHGLNVRYGTGNGGDGMGEGNGDVFALFVFDTPINGEDFFLTGADIRNGNNTRQFCGDCDPGCYGEVHRDGEVWMGAAWKVRTQLDNTLGNVAGDLVADQLFMAWMNAFDQTQIQSVIEHQWLLLDDTDGNLANGTPHFAEIRAGFAAQGFPGYHVEVAGMTALPNQSCELGAYPVSVLAGTTQGTTITSVVLTYSVDGGAAHAVPMTNTGGSSWSGNIPYVLSPAHLEYNVTVTDSAGHVRSAQCTPREFAIGVVSTPFLSEAFDGAGANGWTHGTNNTPPASTNDDWARGDPAGDAGTQSGVPWSDPQNAFSGVNCWSNDLGIGTSNGRYQAGVDNFLRSPAFDFTGRTNLVLVFQRWLTVEEGVYDQATILVDGVEVWANPLNGHTLDTGWTTQTVFLGPTADNDPSATIEFRLESDGGLELGGWQIDDVRLAQFVTAPACSTLTSFCAGDGTLATACPCANLGSTGRGCANSVNSNGGLLVASGAPNPDTLVLTGSGFPNVASPSSVFLQGDVIDPAGILFGDGVRCIDGTLVRIGTKAFPAGTATYPEAGDASLSVRGGVVPGSGVSRGYQVYYRNASAAFCPPQTFNVTNGVRVIW